MKTVLSTLTRSVLMTLFALLLLTQSCRRQKPTDYAMEWTNKMKELVLKFANQEPDSTFRNTAAHEISFYKNGKILKRYYLNELMNRRGDRLGTFDTSMIVYFGKDPNFQYAVQPCVQNQDRSYEGLVYNKMNYGYCKYVNCKDKSVLEGFQSKNSHVGPWITHDSTGKLTQEVDEGNVESLHELKDFKYSEN